MNKSKILETLTSISKIKLWISENKAIVLFASALLIILIIESFFHSRVVTIVEKRVIQEIQKRSIPLVFKELDYGYLPPRLIMKDAVYSGGANSAEVSEASISVKFIPLIKLKVVPSTLTLYKPAVKWSFENKKDNSGGLIKLSFDRIMDSFPLYKIRIKNGDLDITYEDSEIRLQELNLDLVKLSRSIKLNIASVTEITHKDFFENFGSNIDVTLDRESLYIKYLNLQKDNSILKVSGSVKTDEIYNGVKKFSNLSYIYSQINELRVNTKFELSDFNKTIQLALKSKKDFSGELQATGYFNQESKEQKSSIAFSANNINLPELKLKSAKLSANVSSTGLELKEGASVSFRTGSTVTIEAAKIERNEQGYWTKFNVKSKRFLLQDLLHTLNVPNESFDSPISLESKCKGSLSPSITLSCDGDLEIERFILTLRESPFVDLNKLQSSFNIRIGAKELSFSARPVYKNSEDKEFTGNVNGNIHFLKGFSINYETKAFDFEFLNSVAGQELTGIISADGKTEGSAKWGNFYVNILDSDRVAYNDFHLGSAKAKVAYNYPNLTVSDAMGIVNDTDTYTADFALNTDADIMNLNVEGEGFKSSTVRSVFQKSFDFPEGIVFSRADFKLSMVGEPDIEKIDLDLSARVPNLNIFGEELKNSDLNLSGRDGSWSFKDTKFRKNESSFNVTGKVMGFKEIDLVLKSLDLNLEEVDNLQQSGLKLSGPAVFRLEASGPIDGPKAIGRVQLKSTMGLRADKLGSTDVGFRIYEDEITFKGDAFDKKIVGSGIYPLNDNGSIGFNGKVTDLDFFNICEFKFDDSAIHYLPLNFTSDVRFSLKDKAQTLEGWVDDVDIEFKNANEKILEIKNLNKIDFDKNDSALSIISNEDYKTKLYINAADKREIEIGLDGKLEAHTLQAFIPKTEILRGLIDIRDVKLFINQGRVRHDGRVNLSNGTFKNKSFPYSFTDINTNLRLNNNKITFNRVNARVNNNPVLAEGYVKTFPLYLQTSLKYKDLQLEYPEGITSFSDGVLKVSGASLPLLAKGKIVIKKGTFEKDLLSGSDGKTITANKFLPKTILYKNAPPFNLDLILQIEDNYIVKTTGINGYAKGELKLDGNALNPLTKGRVDLKEGMTIRFLDKIFAIEEGRLNYRNDYIDSPNLYIDATTEVFDNNDITSNKYVVRMLVEGPAENLKFNFSSIPSLAEKEIISLLTLGTISTQAVGQEINTQQQATHSGLQVGSFLLQKNKGIQELQKKTGTEIGISSSVDAFNVNPKVQLKKKWTPKFSSTVSQSFGNQQTLLLSTEYKVNKKVSTSFTIQNNQTQDATQLLNRQVQQGEIFGADLQYKFEFD